MVFIHGGRYLFGSANVYRPAYFVEKDVVFITISYRIHILGFLCLDTKEVPGNAGAKDIVLALQWIKDNITYFNGDKDNVTIFGESAGSCLAAAVAYSPLNDGLVHKMINESGTLLSDNFMTDEDEFDKAKRVCKVLGSNHDSAEDIHDFLVKVPIEDLVRAVVQVEQSLDHSIPRSLFQPVVEKFPKGAFLTVNPKKTFLTGNIPRLPTIVGYNSHEALPFVKFDDNNEVIKVTDFKKYLPLTFKLDKTSRGADQVVGEIDKFYFQNDNDYILNNIRMIGDNVFLRDTHRFIDGLVVNDIPVYMYKFFYMGQMSTKYLQMLGYEGAIHSDQLRYQFFVDKHRNIDSNDAKIVRFFAEAWTSFARTGVPEFTHNENLKWPPITRDHRYCLSIDKSLSIIEYPDKESVLFWKHIFAKYYQQQSKL